MDVNSKKMEGPLALIRPSVDKQKAIQLAYSLYGLTITDPLSVKEFVSYDDRNFYLKGSLPEHEDGEGLQNENEFVLKILNHLDSQNIAVVNAHNEVMLYLKKHGFTCPVPARALNGEYTTSLKYSDAGVDKQENGPARVYAVRLLSFVPGKLLKDVPCTSQLLFSVGRYVAEMHKVLQKFDHPGFGALIKQEWDLCQLPTIKSYITAAARDDREQKVLTHVYDNFVKKVIPKLEDLDKQVIHGDINDENILVIPNECGDGHKIASIIDFGDMSVSYALFDIAICMAYMIILRVNQGDSYNEAIRMAGHALLGYQSVNPLSQAALSVLYWSVAARLFQSAVVGLYKQSLEPENGYLSCSCKLAINILPTYITIPAENLLNSWLSMAGE